MLVRVPVDGPPQASVRTSLPYLGRYSVHGDVSSDFLIRLQSSVRVDVDLRVRCPGGRGRPRVLDCSVQWTVRSCVPRDVDCPVRTTVPSRTRRKKRGKGVDFLSPSRYGYDIKKNQATREVER